MTKPATAKTCTYVFRERWEVLFYSTFAALLPLWQKNTAVDLSSNEILKDWYQ